MSDGTYECVMFAEDKYFEQNGELVEIDNSIVAERLISGGTEYGFTNKANDTKAYFGKNELSVLIASGANTISFGSDCTCSVQPVIGGLQSMENIGDISLSGKSYIAYPGAFAHTDLVYEVKNSSVKEYIVLNNEDAPIEISFDFSSEGLTAKKTECGSVLFIDQNEMPVFELGSLFAVDSAGAYTEDLDYSIEQKSDGKTAVIISLSNEYADSPERVFPIVIDPSVMITGSNKVYDAYVSSKYPSNNYGTKNFLRMGWDSNYYIRRSYIRYDLSGLPAGLNGYYLVEAYISLKLDSCGTSPSLKAYRVTGSWSQSTITWDNKPGYSSSNPSDTAIPKSNNWYRLYVTNMVYNWYSGTFNNYGFLIKNDQESGTGNWSTFYSTEADSPNKPELRVRYRVEDYYTNFYRGYSVAYSPEMILLAAEVDSVFNSKYYYGDSYTCDLSKSAFIDELTSKKVISVLSHGGADHIHLSETLTFTLTDLSAIFYTYLANLKLVCFGACKCGLGGENAINLVTAMYDKGVDAVIGFKWDVPVDQTNLWVKVFMQTIACGKTISFAMEAADTAVIDGCGIGTNEDFPVSELHRLLCGSDSFVPCPY